MYFILYFDLLFIITKFTITNGLNKFIDASFSSADNKVGLGMCIRDSAEFHVRSKIMWFTPLCFVDVGEVLGLYHAIRWIHELQLVNVDFEVDSKRVADYFSKGRGDVTEFGSIMDSSIQFCRSFLTNSRLLGGKQMRLHIH